MKFLIPIAVEQIIKTIENAGGEAFIVGGCVRDMLLSKTPDDFDVTTSLLPEEIIPLFEKTIPTGLKHGTVTVVIDKKCIEVTTYRTDGTYSDSRHPENVSFVKNLREDLARRDFTVNALAYNEKTGIVDKFGGLFDIENKILRAVGDPKKRFTEDALRILRLFRFSAQLKFTIEENTFKEAILCKGLLENISRERIAIELFKALMSDSPENINPLLSCGALKFCGITENTITESIKALPKDRNLRFFAFVKENKADYNAICKNLKTDKKLLRFCSEADKLSSDIPFDKVSCKKALSKYSEEAVKAVMILNGKDISLIDKIKTNKEPYKISDLALSGKDLNAINIKGEKVGETLELLLDAVINNPQFNTKEKLIEISRNQ